MNHITTCSTLLVLCFIFSANTIFQTTKVAKASIFCRSSDKFQVLVFNKIPQSDPHNNMDVHCYSRDNDIGYHRLSPGADVNFSFCNDIFDRTLFACHIWWYNRDRAFDAFKSKVGKKCQFGRCTWEARQDGIYYSNSYPPLNLQKMFNWNVHE